MNLVSGSDGKVIEEVPLELPRDLDRERLVNKPVSLVQRTFFLWW